MFNIKDRYINNYTPVCHANDNRFDLILHNLGIMAQALFDAISNLPDAEAKRILSIISEEVEHQILGRLI